MDRIQYNDGYKYQLKQDYALSVPLKPAARFDSDFLQLETDGRLLIKQGYAWDGPSGPTIDTLNFMRGSLVHDALYQLMREDCLDHIQDRAVADQLLRAICIADGCGGFAPGGSIKACVGLVIPTPIRPANADPSGHRNNISPNPL